MPRRWWNGFPPTPSEGGEAPLRPLRHLSQNFLTDPHTLDRIAEAALPQGGEAAVEIGAGRGNLTRRLAPRARLLWAVEIDPRFAQDLESLRGSFPNLRILQENALRLDWARLTGEAGGPLVGVGNIPYGITGALLEALLAAGRAGEVVRAVLLVQREVAQRLVAPVGSHDYSALSIRVAADAEAAVLFPVPAGRFFPKPKVDSALIELQLRPHPALAGVQRARFDRIVSAAFSSRRKTLRNALSGGLGIPPAEAQGILEGAGIDPGRRPQTLSLSDFSRLAGAAR